MLNDCRGHGSRCYTVKSTPYCNDFSISCYLNEDFLENFFFSLFPVSIYVLWLSFGKGILLIFRSHISNLCFNGKNCAPLSITIQLAVGIIRSYNSKCTSPTAVDSWHERQKAEYRPFLYPALADKRCFQEFVQPRLSERLHLSQGSLTVFLAIPWFARSFTCTFLLRMTPGKLFEGSLLTKVIVLSLIRTPPFPYIQKCSLERLNDADST